MSKVVDTIVIGGGQAGLASGYHLQKAGLDFMILEAGDQPAGAWPQYYDSLKLFSPARYSSLPGFAFPKDLNEYPLRDEVISYLRVYAEKFKLPLMVNSKVERVEAVNGGFDIITLNGKRYRTKSIISASGSFHRPYIPNLPGTESFQGNLLHSSEYKRPEPFREQRVIVVGRGNSGVQIAVELADYATVSLAVQHPVKFTRQRFLGLDLHFWLKMTGVDTFPFYRIGKEPPSPISVFDLGGYRKKIDNGNPNQKQMFSGFYPEGIIWANGDREPADSVIFATGYRPNIPFLHQTGALAMDGKPLHVAGVSTEVPGLYYVGLANQRSFASATIRGVGADAKYVVQHITRFLGKQ
ncbi:FAD-dependent oxidoreductase [Paenibacillus sp. FSL R5-0636]|uniref:FAD-dependent oxidoreductase n=1 Tax=Paenibacillus TaxID=44249 RepID=UPI00096DB21F|nr:FAD-dependent oxidoreductase [Paenibacillus odorifer]OMD04107.1 monooxygenase [Paenibacillus odorifer]